jgi:integrase/recombinase XerD
MRRLFPRTEGSPHEASATVPLAEALRGFLAEARARALSPETLTWYSRYLGEFCRYLEEYHEVRTTADIAPAHIRGFQSWLAAERRTFPNNKRADAGRPLSATSLHMLFRASRAFLRWLTKEGLADPALPAVLVAPRVRPKPITPLSADQVALLLKQPDRRTWTGKRDALMMLLLVDTGLRIGELLRLKLADVDLARQTLQVKGKNADRIVPFGTRVRRELAAYLRTRKAAGSGDAVFVSEFGRPLSRNRAALLVSSYGKHIGLRVHPHLLRHTAALMMLRAGMNVFALKAILGHATLYMTNRYLALSESDIMAAHRQASPADNLSQHRQPDSPG